MLDALEMTQVLTNTLLVLSLTCIPLLSALETSTNVALYLRITEFNFNPSVPLTLAERSFSHRSFEFIELKNIHHTKQLSLASIRVTHDDGVLAVLPLNTSLPPSGFGCIVRDQAAFLTRYGGGRCAIIGTFAPTHGLSNLGEVINIFDLTISRIVITVAYFKSCMNGWPRGTANNRSLVLIDQASPQNESSPLLWRASTCQNGSFMSIHFACMSSN